MIKKALTILSFIGFLINLGCSARAIGFGWVNATTDRYYVHNKSVPYEWAKLVGNVEPPDGGGVFVNITFNPKVILESESPILPSVTMRKESPYRMHVRFHEPTRECQMVRINATQLQFEDGTQPIRIPMKPQDRFGGTDGWYMLRDNLGAPKHDYMALIPAEESVDLEPGLNMWVAVDYSVMCNGQVSEYSLRRKVHFEKKVTILQFGIK
ncbi:MAG: hypothetical protein IID41_06220 [Planctomycetes bacterium]|nr:hypothetical protein [Planctomycetota bacterium]